MVEWLGSNKKALLFLLEEESISSRFSIERLAHYCLDIHELYKTDNLVPIVIFLKGGQYQQALHLGSETHIFLKFHFIACDLSTMDASLYLDSDNIVARLNLPLMCYNKEQRVDVYARSVAGLTSLEKNLNQQAKYIDYIDQYAELSDAEQAQYQAVYLKDQLEGDMKMGIAQLLRDEGRQEGIQKGIQEGIQEGINREKTLLIRQIRRRFGDHIAFQTQSVIKSIQSTETLEVIGDFIIDCIDGEQFIKAIESIDSE